MGFDDEIVHELEDMCMFERDVDRDFFVERIACLLRRVGRERDDLAGGDARRLEVYGAVDAKDAERLA